VDLPGFTPPAPGENISEWRMKVMDNVVADLDAVRAHRRRAATEYRQRQQWQLQLQQLRSAAAATAAAAAGGICAAAAGGSIHLTSKL
jgi:hypothetical protein